jgi:hypothetical protein
MGVAQCAEGGRVIGPKKLDALSALVTKNHTDGHAFADRVLIRQGYAEKEADVTLERVIDGRLAECGVSARTGWLEERGVAELEAAIQRDLLA